MSGLAKGIDVVTFGCRLNTYESEVMRREAEAAGLGTLAGGAVIFNTCAVTGEAVRQARQAIRKARRENPDARIIVTPLRIGSAGRRHGIRCALDAKRLRHQLRQPVRSE